MKVKINPLTVVLFFILAITGNIRLYIITYGIMALHELAHFIAAWLIGLKCESITFSPFGVNLKLRSKIIYSFSDAIILYSAGPLLNGILALLSIVFKKPLLYNVNISLMILNLLPIFPLDGGMILMRVLSQRKGRKYACYTLKTVSVVLSFAFLTIAIYGIYRGYINISMFILSILFIGNILTSKEKYDIDLITALSANKKYTNKVNFVLIDSEHTKADAIKTLSPSYTTIALSIDENGNIKSVIPERSLTNI